MCDVPCHQVLAGLGQLLVKGQQHLSLVRLVRLLQVRSTAHSGHVPHSSAWSLLLQTGRSLPAARVLIQAGQVALFPGPEVALLEWLKDVAVQAFYDELDEVLPVGKTALEEPHDDHMVGQRDCVVVELEGVCVGQGDCKNHEKLFRVEVGKNLLRVWI